MNLSQEEFALLTQQAMKFAEENLFEKSEEILKYLLEKLPSHFEVTLSELIVLNNLSFIYQKTGDWFQSQTLLSRGYTFKPLSNQDLSYLLATLINLSAINHTLGYHQQSLQQAFKALELSNNSNLPELKVTASYNLSSILKTLNRITKASYFFRETTALAQSLLGSKHKLTILSQKGSAACINPENFHNRIKSSGYTSKHTSFSISTPRVTKYKVKALEGNELENRMKINLSTKIAAIGRTASNFANRASVFASPYVKDMKIPFKIDVRLFGSPKKEDRETRIRSIGKEIYLKGKVDERVKKIKGMIGELEKMLERFKCECKEISLWAGFEDGAKGKYWAIVKIQRWFKKFQ